MSFYGSIYYQLVDAFNRLWFSNQGKDSVLFPGEDKLVNPNPAEGVPEDTFEYHSPGRQGVIDLKSGNRWIVFTQNDEDKSFKIWHRGADAESNVPGNGFQYIPNMYLVIQQPGETIEEAITRCIQETTDRIAEEGGTFTPEEGCRVVIEIPSEEENIDPSHVIYKYNIDGEWEEEQAEAQGMVTILSPDDFFITTESYAVDAAGHMIPGPRHLYKMPKSDVQEEIEALKTRMTKNEEHDEDQDEDIELLDEYVGDWEKYRGTVSRLESTYWVPSVADAIGDMCELIVGRPTSFNDDGSIKETFSDYKSNKDVTIARVIGNLTKLRNDLKTYDNAHFNIDEKTKLSDISLIDVILYLKNNLIAANTEKVEANKALITNLTYDINTMQNDTIPAVQAKNVEQDGRLDTVENRATILEGRADTLEDRADDLETRATNLETRATNLESRASDLEAEDTRINGLITDLTKTVADHSIASTEAHNDLSKRITDLSDELKAKIDSDVAAESIIINNRIDSEVNTIKGEINKINNAETGILKTANNYTDSEIDDLDYTDSAAADGQYVYSVNETNGVIEVTHKPLPTYTLTPGRTNGTIALNNGNDVVVTGLDTAAYSPVSAFDASGAAATAKTEAIAAAKTETENQIKALSEGAIANNTKAIADNAKAIDDLEVLLQDYNTLVTNYNTVVNNYNTLSEKVAELEGRITALESKPEEPTPDPGTGGENSETT